VIDAALADLAAAAGTRLPGTLDAFEMAVRAVLGQRVTVAGARTLASRLVERFGEPVDTPWPEQVHRRFPTPQRLARARAESIGTLGILRTQVGAIHALARAWPVLCDLAARSTPEALVEHIAALPGFGPWTAQYLVMRWLGWPDAFPPGDVAVLKAMSLPKGKSSERDAEARSQAWRPWRSYAVLRLWSSLETL
jgi:AraC family transcriptional regulator, regulatory protein of adaptative response / DNA-3-methyladenine glycosylase II